MPGAAANGTNRTHEADVTIIRYPPDLSLFTFHLSLILSRSLAVDRVKALRSSNARASTRAPWITARTSSASWSAARLSRPVRTSALVKASFHILK